MQFSRKLAGAGRDQQCHSIPNRDSHCCDYRIGQARLDRVSGGKSSSTCDVWNGEKQKFRPAFMGNESNRRPKNPKHFFCSSSEKQSRAYEEQRWQYKQTYQNSSSPRKHIGVQNMRSDARGNRKRPNYHNRQRLTSKVGEQVKPQGKHRSQCEQAPKADGAAFEIPLLATCCFAFDVFRHGHILLLARLPI